MNGYVDDAGRALLDLEVRASASSAASLLTVWIDTAFTGELVVSRKLIESLALPQSAAVMAGLADGSQVVLETFTCVLDWFGTTRSVEVIANDGQFPLLGVGLLQDEDLRSTTRNVRLRLPDGLIIALFPRQPGFPTFPDSLGMNPLGELRMSIREANPRGCWP